jgi:hypothetical protein
MPGRRTAGEQRPCVRATASKPGRQRPLDIGVPYYYYRVSCLSLRVRAWRHRCCRSDACDQLVSCGPSPRTTDRSWRRVSGTIRKGLVWPVTILAGVALSLPAFRTGLPPGIESKLDVLIVQTYMSSIRRLAVGAVCCYVLRMFDVCLEQRASGQDRNHFVGSNFGFACARSGYQDLVQPRREQVKFSFSHFESL